VNTPVPLPAAAPTALVVAIRVAADAHSERKKRKEHWRGTLLISDSRSYLNVF